VDKNCIYETESLTNNQLFHISPTRHYINYNHTLFTWHWRFCLDNSELCTPSQPISDAREISEQCWTQKSTICNSQLTAEGLYTPFTQPELGCMCVIRDW